MKKIDKTISSIENVLTAVCFALMSIITILGVFFRYVMRSPLIWSEELSRYLMIWGVFIGISVVTRKKAQLGIDIFVAMAPKRIRRILGLISSMLLVVMYVILFFLSANFVLVAASTGQLTPILRVPFYWVYLAMPVGFFLSSVRAVQVFWAERTGKDDEETEVYL